MCLSVYRTPVSKALVLSALLHALALWAILRLSTPVSQAVAATTVLEVEMLTAPQASPPVTRSTAGPARRAMAQTVAAAPRRSKPLQHAVAPTPPAAAGPVHLASAKSAVISLPSPVPAQTQVTEPFYLDQPLPRYPGVARRRRLEGVVLLRVEVGDDGVPLRVELQRSSGHDVLDEAARTAVRTWRFVPASRSGHAVRAVVQVPVRFRLAAAE